MVAHLLGVLKPVQLIGISAWILCVIAFTPPLLWVAKRLRTRRQHEIFSLTLNVLEVMGYTIAIHFTGGVEAAFLTLIYGALIFYVGMVAPSRFPIIVAVMCVTAFTMMVLAEHFGVLPSYAFYPSPTGESSLPLTSKLMLVGAVDLILLVGGFMASRVGGMLQASRRRIRHQNTELVREITERRSAEEELERHRHNLEELVADRTTELEAANLKLMTEIEERIRAEQELKDIEEKYRTLTGNLSMGLYRATPGPVGRTIFTNPALVRLFGYDTEEELAQVPVADLYAKPEERLAISDRVLAKGSVADYEILFKKKDGGYFWGAVSAKAVRNESGEVEYLEGVVEDITVRKLAEEEKDRLVTQLQQAQKMEVVGTLAGGIAHDFNNILAAVMGYTELALDKVRDRKPSQDDLEQVLKAAGRGKDLIKQILTFSRRDAAEMKPLSLNRTVLNAVDMLARTIPKMIEIELNLPEDLKTIKGDINQLEQVLINFSNNAADAMPDGGRLLIETDNVILDEEYCRAHTEARPGAHVLLRIADTGQGMDQETVRHVFEPFFTTKEVGHGTGLGLSTVFGIVQSHGGHIICQSELGSGTVFNVYLPAVRTSARDDHLGTEDRADIRGGAETILVVDDEQAIRMVVKSFLESLGYTVLTADSGEEALNIYRDDRDRINLVLLDLGMPGMGGQKALVELRALDSEARIVIASGYSADGLRQAAREAGAAAFIAKPYLLRDMARQIREVLDR